MTLVSLATSAGVLDFATSTGTEPGVRHDGAAREADLSRTVSMGSYHRRALRGTEEGWG
jgi:hypothetical protein